MAWRRRRKFRGHLTEFLIPEHASAIVVSKARLESAPGRALRPQKRGPEGQFRGHLTEFLIPEHAGPLVVSLTRVGSALGRALGARERHRGG
jgi:hypothetical protein